MQAAPGIVYPCGDGYVGHGIVGFTFPLEQFQWLESLEFEALASDTFACHGDG